MNESAIELNKRVKKNPFYQHTIKLLAAQNFHMIRPEFGHHGSLNVTVFCDNREGIEVRRTFNLPARADSLQMIRWKEGLQADVARMLEEGLRPPRSQFGQPKPKAEKPREVAEAEKIFKPTPKPPTPPKPLQEVLVLVPELVPAPVQATEDILLTFQVNAADAPTVIETLQGVGKLPDPIAELSCGPVYDLKKSART